MILTASKRVLAVWLVVLLLGVAGKVLAATAVTESPGTTVSVYRGTSVIATVANYAACVERATQDAATRVPGTYSYGCQDARDRLSIKVTADPLPQPVNCEVSAWSDWQGGAWSACSNGQQARAETRSRTVTRQAANGGQACPALTETRTATQPCTVPPPPVSGAAMPLSWDDPVFSGVTSSGRLSLASGQSRLNLSIAEQSGEPSITCNGSCNLERIRIRSREGYRCVSGNQNLSWMWIEAIGTGSDHADGIQCYSPNSTGTLTLKNSTIKVGGAVNAAYFAADNWKGSHVLENVLIWGGRSGFFVPGDGGTSVSLTNVYFVEGSFVNGPLRMDTVNGKRPTILKWENVRYVRIVNGALVMGDLIPKPY